MICVRVLAHAVSAVEDLDAWLDPFHANNLTPGREAGLKRYHAGLRQRNLDKSPSASHDVSLED